jgi:SAM-dependent methyltransferase
MTDRSATETLWREYAASRAEAADDIRRVLEGGLGPRDWAGSRVLDLGCGDGAIAAAFAGAGGRVVAMDLDPWRVDNTRRLADDQPGARLDVVSADGHRLPFARDAFDLVILSDLIEHVKDPGRVMEEVTRVLAPGGAVYVSVPNRLSLVNVVSDPHYNVPAVGVLPRWLGAWCVTRLFRVSHQFTVERYFTWRGAKRLFRDTGLAWRRVPGWYEERLASGAVPKAPARRWLVSVARAPVVRWLLPAVLEGAIFRLLVLPAWEFVASKPPAPAR